MSAFHTGQTAFLLGIVHVGDHDPLPPVVADISGQRIISHHSLGLFRKVAQFLRVRAADARLDIIVGIWTVNVFPQMRLSLGQMFGEPVREMTDQTVNGTVIIDIDDDLAE